MTCWETLQIPADSDRSTIRKAYARLIKTFRPDDSPKEFQDIHDAYQEALVRLRHPAPLENLDADGQVINKDSPGQACADETKTAPEEFLPPGMTQETFQRIHEAIEKMRDHEMILEIDDFRITRGETPDEGFRIEKLYSPETDSYRAGLSDEFRNALDGYLSQLEAILELPDSANPKHWDFLADCPYLLDNQFRYQLTGDILRIIANYNLSRDGAVQAPIGVTAMHCLDQYLGFSDAGYEDYHQITEREWNALRMPGRDALGFSGKNRGLKGGKLVEGRANVYRPEPQENFWMSLLRFGAFGAIAVIILFVLVAMVASGKGSFIFIFAGIAAIKFLSAIFVGAKDP